MARSVPWRRRIAVILVPGAIILGSSLAPGTAAGANDPSTVRVGLSPSGYVGGLPQDLNMFTGWPFYPTALTYEALSSGGGLFVDAKPQFAESWSSSADKTEWTFKIAPDKKWSDGQPATARDVAFTYQYLLDSVGTKSELGIGQENVNTIKKYVRSVTAPDDQTVVFGLKTGSDFLTRDATYILPQHVYKDVTYEQLLGAFKPALPMVGTGPYVATEFKSGESLRLERNPYFTRPAQTVDEIVFSTFESADVCGQALAKGEIDFCDGVTDAFYKGLGGQAGLSGVSAPTPWHHFLAYNTLGTKGGAVTDALADPAFRDALGYAIDRPALLEKVLGGIGTSALTSAGVVWGDYNKAVEQALQPTARRFDLAEANRRLDAAGYKDANGDGIREDKAGKSLSLRLYFETSYSPAASIAAQFIQDWFRQIGIEITATSMDLQALQGKAKPVADGGGNWDLAIAEDWPGSPDTMFEAWLTSSIGTRNMTYFSDSQVDALDLQRLTTEDRAAKLDLAVQEAQRIYQLLPGDVLYFFNIQGAYRTDRFTGWDQAPADGNPPFDSGYPKFGLVSLQVAGPTPTAAASAEAPSAGASAAALAPTASSSPDGGTAAPAGDSTPILVAGAVVVILVVGVLVVTRRRRLD